MVNNEIWIDIKTVAEIKGITSRAIRLAFAKGKYIFRETKQQGGKSYEILLSSLEPRVQDIYKHTYYREIIEAVNHEIMIPVTKSVETETGFIPETAKTIALARVDLVLDWQKFRDKHNPKHKGDELFLDLYNSGEYLKNVFTVIGKTSRGSLQRWHKSYSEHETWEVLVPQYNYRSFNEYRTILSEEEIGVFLKLLLHPNQFSIAIQTDNPASVKLGQMAITMTKEYLFVCQMVEYLVGNYGYQLNFDSALIDRDHAI